MQVFELSTKIKELCKANKTSVKLLLEKCDINRNFIYDLERNGQIPSFDKIVKIAEYFDISIDYLAGRTDNPVNPNLYINNVEFEAAHKKAEDFEIEQKNKDIEF